MNKQPNRLINEKSPYLLQHAYNPVDWYPWGEEAFNTAKSKDIPVFLSIGYSTCHWCHVMERESFEDNEVAELLNDNFICIKVDREERPDVDAVYMSACQAMTGSGGWPLSVFLTSDKKPFFTGTYFPKSNRYGRMGLIELANRMMDLWQNQRQDIFNSAEQIVDALQNTREESSGDDVLEEETLHKAFEIMFNRFDERYGGFGSAPKFPTPHQLFFLLRYWKKTGNYKALMMVENTLESMGRGGVYDHIGFGFHRYSTDAKWLLPHFEKMLYDQALLAIAYTEVYQATGKENYALKVKEIFTYLLRDMTGTEGGFYSAEDADSEGVEGKFYVWTAEELKEVLGEKDYSIATLVYNVKDDGNFIEEASGEKVRANILHIKKPIEELAAELQVNKEVLLETVNKIREKLFDIRKKRIHPYKDDKVLTDWNGLMIAALAYGGTVLKEESYVDAAQSSANFILEKMRDNKGRLLKSYRDGEAKLTGHADDYAFFIWGLIELYEATFSVKYLKEALEINDMFLKLFWDHEKGGLYFTAEDAEPLPIRPKDAYDGATPSANSIELLNLLRLARMTGRQELEEKANVLLKAFAFEINRYPAAYTQFLSALSFSLGPAYEVVITGNKKSKDTEEMLTALYDSFFPNKVILLKDENNSEDNTLEDLAPFIKEQKQIEGKATAYVCRNFACQAPTTKPEELLNFLN